MKDSTNTLIVDTNGKTALRHAVSEGNLDMETILIQSNSNLNIRDTNERTTLHYAVFQNNLEILKQLITSNANLDICDYEGQTALHISIAANRIEICRCLVESGANLEIANIHGNTALHLACSYGRLEAFKFLVKSNANIHQVNNDGQTCLHLAVQPSSLENFEIAKILIEKGLDVNAKDKFGSTPILGIGQSVSHIYPRVQLTKLLLKNGANPNLENQFGNALHIAASQNSADVVKILLEHKMDVNVKNRSGETVLSNFFNQNSNDLYLLRLLVEYGAKLSIPHEPLQTPQLMSLVRTNTNFKKIGCYSIDWEFAVEHKEITEAFLNSGFDVNEINEKGFMPLFFAAAFGPVDVIEQLINRGANIMNQNSFGYSALHFAANYGKIENLKVLVKESKGHINFNSIVFAALQPTLINSEFNKELERNRQDNIVKNRNTFEILKWLIEEKHVAIDIVDEFGRNLLELACKCDFLDVFKYLMERNTNFLHDVLNSYVNPIQQKFSNI